MKTLFKNNYITITAVKGLLLGVAVDDDQFLVVIGCIGIEFNNYMFKRRRNNKSSKPQSF